MPTIIQTPSQPAVPFVVGDANNVSIDHSTSTTVPVGLTPEQGRTAEPESFPERLLDRYQIQTLLGKGGFGYMFSAWDEVLERVVAIKLARKDRFDGTQGRTHFLEEARAAAKLKHPHIVTVFDSGTDAEGNPFVVFEFIGGESLAARIARQPLNREEVVSVMSAVADAVHVAHKAGLVHRDLKPGNILLDRHGRPHVTDFGLAVDENSQRQQAGLVAGSWSYMSPEQYRGETQYLDGRTDIWSLGVILYELLTGRRPFSGRDSEELGDQILHREAKPLRQIDDSIPVELEQICLKCLSKSVTSRYGSAADVAAALDSRRARTRNLSHSAAIWAAGCASVAAASWLLYAFWISPADQFRPDPPAPSPAIASSDLVKSELVEKSPAPMPKPGKWFPLLQRRPEILAWPEDERNSRWQYSQEDQEVYVDCAQTAMIKLGAVEHGDYKLQMSVFQTRWIGNVGVFFGGHTVEVDGMPCRRVQLIELRCETERGKQQAYLHRRLMIFDKEFNSRSSLTFVGAPVPEPSNREQSMTIGIAGGRLEFIEWNGAFLRELVSDKLSTALDASDHWGDFGLYLSGASLTCRRPELLVISNKP